VFDRFNAIETNIFIFLYFYIPKEYIKTVKLATRNSKLKKS